MHRVPDPISRPLLVLLLLAVAIIWFGNLEYRKLFHPDEGRYAEIPRAMVVTSDWVTPRLNAIKYFEKPPLQYWTTAMAYELFGQSQWTSRLWTALTGFLTVLLVYGAGVRIFGSDAGLFGALVLVSSAGFVLAGHINTLDMGLTFFLTLALVAFLFAQAQRASPSETSFWMHVAWAAAAGAVLSKGLVGALLPAGGLVAYSLLARDFGIWRKVHLLSGMLLFLALAAPWFILVSLANPEFPAFFFVHEHFDRFLTKAHDRYQPWWFFLPVLALGLLPWTTLAAAAVPRALRRDAGIRGFRPRLFLLAYAAFMLVFFSVSSSKLEAYVLPMVPALALVMGDDLTRLAPGNLRWHLAVALIFGAAVIAAPPFVHHFGSHWDAAKLPPAFGHWLQVAGAVLVAGALFGLAQLRRARTRAALVGTALAALLASQLGNTGAESLSPLRSGHDLAAQIAPLLGPDTPFYNFGMYEQTAPFYLKRTATLVGSAEEMAFGLEQEPHLWIANPLDFEPRWRAQPGAVAIMRVMYFDLFQQQGLPMRVIARDDERVAVVSPQE